MNREIDTLYELCETISMELESCNEKIRQANGKLSPGDIDYLDKLTHTMKSLKAVIGMLEAQDSGYSGHFWDGRYYFDGGNSMEGSSNRGSYEGASGRGSYEGGSSNRSYGRGRNANRDRMGRYAERGYSRADAEEDFRTEIEELMNKAPDEQSRKKLEKLMQDMK